MDQVKTLITKIKAADSIVIGAGSGMSNAAGMDFWYQASPTFMENFGQYYEKYHFNGAFNGFYNHFDSEEEHWGFMTTLANLIYEVRPPKPTYEYLQKLLGKKPFHIITTNQDDLFLRFFDRKQVSMIQGSWSYFQSPHPDLDKKLYNAREIFPALKNKVHAGKLSQADIPRSEVDGSPLIPWVRGPEFLEDRQYYEEHQKFNRFIGQHWDDQILFIELGVGRMTPMFIQEPFWEMTAYLPHAFYININPKDAIANPAIADRSLLINEDINKALEQAVNEEEN